MIIVQVNQAQITARQRTGKTRRSGRVTVDVQSDEVYHPPVSGTTPACAPARTWSNQYSLSDGICGARSAFSWTRVGFQRQLPEVPTPLRRKCCVGISVIQLPQPLRVGGNRVNGGRNCQQHDIALKQCHSMLQNVSKYYLLTPTQGRTVAARSARHHQHFNADRKSHVALKTEKGTDLFLNCLPPREMIAAATPLEIHPCISHLRK